MKQILYLFFAWIAVLPWIAAQDCLPISPINLPANQLSEQVLRSLIEEKRLAYSETEVQNEMQRIRACNSQLEIKLQGIENEIAAYSLKAQELYRFKDVSSLRQRLTTLEKSLVDAEKELENSIGQVAQVGVYVVVLENIDPYDSKNTLIKKAQAALHPYVIEDLNGVNIKRLTEVANFDSVKDIIESFTSGEASDRKVFVDKQNFARKYFLYVVQASTLPLADKNFRGRSTTFNDEVFIMKLNETFEGELLKKNVSDEDINTIKRDAVPYLSLSQQENRNNQARQQNIIEKGEREIKKIKSDIEEAKQLLRDRSERIQKICKEYNIRFDATNLDASAQRAFDFFRQNAVKLEQDWKQLKEQEIIPKQTVTTIEGSPAASAAAESMKLYRTLGEQAGKISKTQERVRIEDFEVTDYEAKKDVTLFRKINRVWVYPVPQDGNTFKVFVLAQFKITSAKVALKEASEEQETFDFPIPKTVFVKGGNFTMGCKEGRDKNCAGDEKPAHPVSVKDFYIGQYEVTNEEFCAFLNEKGNQEEGGTTWLEIESSRCGIEKSGSIFQPKSDRKNHPVVEVSWYGAVAYCKWLSEKTGKNYRLPTEAEWEYVARGGSSQNNYAYAGSNDLDKVGWYSSNSGKKTHPVGELQGLSIGDNKVFDLSGNVWEWCQDHWHSDYQKAPTDGSAWTTGGDNSLRVLRGGSWDYDGIGCRVSFRNSYDTGNRSYFVGFRVAGY